MYVHINCSTGLVLFWFQRDFFVLLFLCRLHANRACFVFLFCSLIEESKSISTVVA